MRSKARRGSKIEGAASASVPGLLIGPPLGFDRPRAQRPRHEPPRSFAFSLARSCSNFCRIFTASPRIKPLKALFVGDGKACKPPCLRIVHLDGRLQRKFGLWLAFGPVMVLWFLVMAVLGIWGIAHHPAVRAAVNPLYGLRYLFSNGYASFLVLGGVFSVSPARRRFMPIWDISGRVRSGWPGPASFFRACSSSNRQSRPRGLRRYRAECSTPPHSRHRPIKPQWRCPERAARGEWHTPILFGVLICRNDCTSHSSSRTGRVPPAMSPP